MKVFWAVLLILLPLGVMAAPAGDASYFIPVFQGQWSALPVSGSPASQVVHQGFMKGRGPSLILAHGAADSPEDEESGDGEKDENKGDEEQDGGGWNRLWDCCKLG